MSVYNEKKVDPLAREYALVVSAKTELTRLSCLHVAVKLFTWRKVSPVKRMTLSSIKGEPAETTFVSRANGSPSFIRKGWESWLALGNSGRRVALLSGIRFLHINGEEVH